MLQVYAMSKNDGHSDIINNIEIYLDTKNIEYQSWNNKIEIYSLNESNITIKIVGSKIYLKTLNDTYEYFGESKNLYLQIEKLLI